MKNYNIENPTKYKLDIVYKGNPYSIEPNSTIKNIPEDVALFWKDKIHNFIKITESKNEVKESINKVIESAEEVKTTESKLTKNKK